MVVMRGVNDDEIVEFAGMARTAAVADPLHRVHAARRRQRLDRDQVVTAKEILAKIHATWPLDLVADGPLSDPARIFRFKDGRATSGSSRASRSRSASPATGSG
jgi:molybdenum cofactor biosynthesis enzyme MoaA